MRIHRWRLATAALECKPFRWVAFCFGIGICCALATSRARAQLTPFQQQALLAFNPAGKVPTTITLSGSATWTSGSLTESGSVSLAASSDGVVSENWTLPTQSHVVGETGFAVGKTCFYTDPLSDKQHQSTAPNCIQPVAWFAPWVALGLLPSGNVIGAADVSLPNETLSGIVRLRFATSSPSVSDPSVQARLVALSQRTAVDVSYDSKSALVSSLTFNYVLDNDPKHVVEYAIVFTDYRPEQGIMVPHRIQRYIQRTLQADITITTASIL